MISILQVKFALLHPAARAPTVATDGSVGHDFYAVADCKIQPGRTAIVDTGVAFAIPRGVMGEVRGRSGMATRGVLTHPGTIDQDYRGSVRAILANIGPDDYHISAGHRVAQIVLSPVLAPPPADVAPFPPPEGSPGDVVGMLLGYGAGAFFAPVAFSMITGFAKLVQVTPDELGATARGSGGLGSSGL
jgi:deoxyuridine 5'-triphosphate nucleotidohydrolase